MIGIQYRRQEHGRFAGDKRQFVRVGKVIRLAAKDERREALSVEDMAALLRAVAAHDRTAFAKLFQYFAPRLKAMAMSGGMATTPAEDLAQDAMLTVWRKAHLFDPSAGTASAWIYTIARNRRIDLSRSAQRAPQGVDISGIEQVDEQPLPDAALATMQMGDRVRVALEHLNEDQKCVVGLSFFENLSHSEISERLGIPLGTVKSRLRLAFQRLRELLSDLQ